MNSAAFAHSERTQLNDESFFEAILEVLCERSGADFRRYRVATLRRRVLNRMISARTATFGEYLRLLETDPLEAEHLLNRVTIKVSRFYRNQVTFDALREEVMPTLLAARGREPLRLLSAGCGQGEEPYTLAMLLEEAEASGIVDAIDIDARALDVAATARYAASALEELPEELRDRYLLPVEHGFEVCEAVRTRVAFSRGDLMAVTPFAAGVQYDLICCRNVLIYFEREVQERTLSTLCRHLRSGGFLCLGEAEWPMPSLVPMLQPLAHKTRLFRLLSGIRHVTC